MIKINNLSRTSTFFVVTHKTLARKVQFKSIRNLPLKRKNPQLSIELFYQQMWKKWLPIRTHFNTIFCVSTNEKRENVPFLKAVNTMSLFRSNIYNFQLQCFLFKTVKSWEWKYIRFELKDTLYNVKIHYTMYLEKSTLGF